MKSMVKIDRNTFIDRPWVLEKVDNIRLCNPFDCGDDDLDEYFNVDAIFHKKELLTETYCLHLENLPSLTLALLDFCNDAVQLRKFEAIHDIGISPQKQYPSLPSVKLTRFGVAKEYQGLNIGSHVLNMIKILFITDNRTGCRFITVDAYNDERVLRFYKRNGFKLISNKDREKDTRALYFDLKRFKYSKK